MSFQAEMAERHGAVLGELAELGMTLVRGLHEQALAAATPEAADRLALAFHRLSRSVRQTLALEARLVRERRRDAIEDGKIAAEARRARVGARKSQANAALSRLIWREAERGEIGELLVELKQRLDEEALDEAFADGPVEALIARIRKDLGLAANDAGAGPFPPDEAPGPRGADWRSSA